MAFFKPSNKYKPLPVPVVPPYVPEPVPEQEEGTTPEVPRGSFTGDSDIVLYVNMSDAKKAFKTLNNQYVLNMTFKKDIDILNPVFEITSDTDITQYNYVYISAFDRYYFATITCVVGRKYRVVCNVDPLSSFIESIAQIPCIIDKEEQHNNLYLNDGTYVQGVKNYSQVYNFSNGFNSTPENILICAGGYNGV